MNNIENIIEQYLAKTLSDDAVREFENRLASDIDFAEEYKKTLAAHQLIIEAGRLELKKTLESFEETSKETSEIKKVMPLWIKRALPIAAMLVVFFGVYQFINLNKSYNNAAIFEMYFDAYSNPSTIRDSESNSIINWQEASNYYSAKDYKNAMEYFKKSEGEVPDYLTSFYLGVSSLASKRVNYNIALEHFENVLLTDNDYNQQAFWYKGLTLLKLDKSNEALEIFKTIVKNSSFKNKEAKEILELSIKN